MAEILRFLAVMLLALSIPVQGMAAIAAGQCMTMGHHQGAAGHDHQAHAHEGADGHEHAAHSDHESVPAHDNQESKASHCGPCAACCASASIAGFAGTAIPAPPSTTKYVFSQLPPSGFQLDGVDRPPLAL